MGRRGWSIQADRNQPSSLGPAPPGQQLWNQFDVHRLLRARRFTEASGPAADFRAKVDRRGRVFHDRPAVTLEARSEVSILAPPRARPAHLRYLVRQGSASVTRVS